ncbi:hypothetical protein [Streptomyces virginiae]|uniref:hypothetical protein n=1 Tax=Streptomyces virginiae TaxID=1961 RepID=UPI003867AC83|nr:hypothetical protein OG253_00035 [Streptomyces virginiae]WTB27289.1 hypothetical protein OG253_40800 [Streptomyces virginiae]
MNVSGTVWDAGRKRAGQDEVSISHAVSLFLEAYTAGLLDLDTITAQLDALAAGKDPAAVPSPGAWTEEAPPAFPHPSWSSGEGVPRAHSTSLTPRTGPDLHTRTPRPEIRAGRWSFTRGPL